MILHSLRVENFCKFRQPFELSKLNPGLNLITGPNEAGKSTLVRAIRTVFLERYNTSTLAGLQPYGNTAVAPSVAVTFSHNNQAWSLTKSFNKTQRCDLSVGSQQFSNSDAENKLAELLRYSYAKKGSSKPEHQGIPGLLWVEQGSGQELSSAAQHAGDHLQAALSSLVGNINHTEGDNVLQQVVKQWSALHTDTGRPKDELKTSMEAVAELQQQKTGLEQKIRQHQQDVDRLGQLRADIARLQQEKPWEQVEQQLADARQQLEIAEQLEQQLQQQQAQRRLLEEALTNLQQQQHQLQQEQQQLQQREQEWQQARTQLTEAEHQQQTAQQQRQQALQEYQAAQALQQQASRWQQLQQIQEQLHALQQEQQRLHSAAEAAQQASAALQALQEQAAGQSYPTISEPALQQLQALQRQCEISQAKLDAVATRLHYQLDAGQQVQLDNDLLQGSGDISISGQAELRIAGVGEFRIVAGGGASLASQQREYDHLQQQYQQQLQQLQVSDPEQARQRLQQQQAHELAVKEQRQRLQHHAPQGLAELQQQVAFTEQRRQEKEQQQHALQQQLGDVADPAALKSAEANLQRSDSALKSAEQASQQADVKLAASRADATAAEREYQQLQQRLNDPQRQQQRQQWQQQEQEKLAELALLRQQEQQQRDQLQAINPVLLRQDCDRFQRSIANQQDALQQKQHTSITLAAKLQAEGATGMDEALQQTEQQLDYAQQRLQQLQRRAAALTLLKDKLQQQRQQLTQKLQAPLQKHLNHYLNLLFPGAAIEVDDQLIPSGFSRSGEHGSLSDLSFGTREQMGLIARLAYADLLQEAGQPTLMILDDSLVHSDRTRLEQMQRILFDAQQRHQILLFSCHPQNWQTLGCKTFDIEQLSASQTRQ